MTVHFVGALTIQETWQPAEYADKVRAQVESFGGRQLVRTSRLEQLEGEGPLPTSVVVLEFPDRSTAIRWWESAEYQELRAIRQRGSSLEAILLLDDPADGQASVS